MSDDDERYVASTIEAFDALFLHLQGMRSGPPDVAEDAEAVISHMQSVLLAGQAVDSNPSTDATIAVPTSAPMPAAAPDLAPGAEWYPRWQRLHAVKDTIRILFDLLREGSREDPEGADEIARHFEQLFRTWREVTS